MKKILLTVPILGVALFLLATQTLSAKPDFQSIEVKNPITGETKHTFSLPTQAQQIAPGVYYLGKSQDQGRTVEGYAFVKYRKDFAKPGTSCGNGICEPGENANKCPADCGSAPTPTPSTSDTSSCYAFLGRGVKWKNVEDYIVDGSNDKGLNEASLKANLAYDISKWEDAADGAVDGNISHDILGNQISGVVDGADFDQTDNKNEVYFANISEPGAIGVTVVWGIFGGPPFARELVEWDQVYDDTDFDWSLTGEPGKMDFANIAIHELGHAVGLADLYTSECSDQTMYGYASYGETNKRTLEAGDITGIRELYK